MEHIKSWFNGSGVNPWVYSSVVFIGLLIVGHLVRRLIWTRLTKFAAKTASTWDDDLLAAISTPVSTLIFIIAFGVAGQSAPPIVRDHPLMRFGVKVALILVAVWILERAMAIFFRSAALPESLTTTSRTLLLTIARTILFVIGVLIVLDTVGVSITPVLASLGISSLAVALALQDTLGNFFSGFYLLVDKPIRIGDMIRVDDIEGEVVRIGWRTTRIKIGVGDIVTLPNSKVASSHLKNYDLPSSYSQLLVPVGVAYESDLEKVERVTLEVAKEILQSVRGADSSFEPVVRYSQLADSSINFNVVLQCTRVTEFGLVRHEFIKALVARYNREGIVIPYPQRVVHWNPGPNP